MAWAERLPGGRWRGGWRLPDGAKRYTKKATHPEHPYRLKSDARAAAVDAEARANRQAAANTGTLSAKIPWGKWWDMIEPIRAKAPSDTNVAERYIVSGYLRPRWGDTPLIEIKHGDVQRWFTRLADGNVDEWTHDRSPEPSYVRRIYATFKASIQHAVDEEVLDATPCTNITLPKVRKKRKQHISVDDNTQLGERLRPDYRDAVALFLETGLRPSELCGLHIEHVDFARSQMEVRATLVSRKRLIREWPKDKDARLVPLTSAAVEIIRRRIGDRDTGERCGLPHVGDGCSSPLVFLTERGKPMNVQVLGDRMRYAAKVHKVPRRTPYAGRRGFATRAARGGMDAFALAAVMGHADVEQTQEYVQDERIGPVLRAALGDREPLKVVEGGGDGSGPVVDGDEVADAR